MGERLAYGSRLNEQQDERMQPNDEDERNLHDDYKRKSFRIPPPKPMRDVLSQLLAKRGYAQLQTAACSTARAAASAPARNSSMPEPGPCAVPTYFPDPARSSSTRAS